MKQTKVLALILAVVTLLSSCANRQVVKQQSLAITELEDWTALTPGGTPPIEFLGVAPENYLAGDGFSSDDDINVALTWAFNEAARNLTVNKKRHAQGYLEGVLSAEVNSSDTRKKIVEAIGIITFDEISNETWYRIDMKNRKDGRTWVRLISSKAEIERKAAEIAEKEKFIERLGVEKVIEDKLRQHLFEIKTAKEKEEKTQTEKLKEMEEKVTESVKE